MRLPEITAYTNRRVQQEKFGGINHTFGASGGELYDMKNLSARYFPLLTPRSRRYTVRKGMGKANGIFSAGKLYEVYGTKLYVNGEEVERAVLSETVTRAPVAEVIAVGTGAEAEASDPDEMPVIADGYITLPTGEVLTYSDTATIRATAYTHTDAGCDMTTYTGTTVHKGTVAVDPRYIPYGTRMFIVSNDGAYVYGIAVAEDCGGDIKGDRMDLYFPTFNECIQFGRRVCTIYFLD